MINKIAELSENCSHYYSKHGDKQYQDNMSVE